MKSSSRYLGFAVIPLFMMAGCATPQHRIEKNVGAFNALPTDQQALIRDGKVGIGFDETAVKLALGDPDQISHQVNANGENTVWRYSDVEYLRGSAIYTGYYRDGLGIPDSNDTGFYSASEAASYAGNPSTFNSPYYSSYHGSIPYYKSVNTREHDRLLVVFTDGKVAAIQK